MSEPNNKTLAKIKDMNLSPEGTNTNLQLVKAKLEKEGEKKTMAAINHMQEISDISNNPTFGQKMMNIMSEGMNDFEKQIGRKMTYSEMREIYG